MTSIAEAAKNMLTEKDPHGKKPNEGGAKLDANKIDVGLLFDFSRALMEVARVSTMGAKKYSRAGWLTVPDGVNRYTAAFGRHIFKEQIEGEYDLESLEAGFGGIRHDAQIAWNALARIELRLREKEQQRRETVFMNATSIADLANIAPGSAVRIPR